MQSFVLLTLAASLLHAFSFVWSKRFLLYSRNRMKLAFYSQYACGAFALLVLPFLHPANFFIAPGLLLSMTAYVLIGQTAFMEALRHGDASFVVPMMGMKMFATALLAALFLSETYSPLVYVGAGGVFLSLFLLNNGTLKGSARATLFVLLCCGLFAAADVTIVKCIRLGYSPLDVVVYSFLLPTLVLLPLSPILFRGDWQIDRLFARDLGLYAAVHVTGIGLLMTAFALAQKATIINIVQTSRGLMAVAVVYLLARLGFAGMEQLTRRQYALRVAGALMMCISLAVAVSAQQ